MASAKERRDSITGALAPGLMSLTDVLRGKKKPESGRNKKGIHVGTEKEKKRVRHRLELKYPKDYPGGGRK